MKNRSILISVWTLCFAAFAGFAQSSVSSPPLVVAVTNISSASVRVWTNGAVSFHFTHSEIASTEDFIRDGVRSRRLVMIMDGEHLLAEARLAGMAHGIVGHGLETADGLVLAFGSVPAADEAASIIRASGTFVMPKIDTEDRSRWIF